MYVVIFICVLFLAFDFVCFSATYSCYKSYKKDMNRLSDRLQSLYISVETKKIYNCYVAVPGDSVKLYYSYFLFLHKSTGRIIIVPEPLVMDYTYDSDYEEIVL